MSKPMKKDTQDALQKIADDNAVAIIGFVAPQDAVRVSPVQFARASIEETDMYELEKIVCKIKNIPEPPKTLHLIIQTPGGELFTSYKIAQFLRNSFETIKAYVPYQAASGGTIICCAANEIYLGDLGNITPIDPQVRYQDTWVSAYAFSRAIDTIRMIFGEQSPEEIPSPWQQMAEKIDPIIHDEMSTAVFNTYFYARKLLMLSGYDEKTARSIAQNLARPDYAHGHPILYNDALDLGLRVKRDGIELKQYGAYVSERLQEKSASHVIDYISPNYASKPTLITTSDAPARTAGTASQERN